ncbi:MAG: flagellar basal body L-ring protein FlgH [Desulfovibrionaceae bacterium]
MNGSMQRNRMVVLALALSLGACAPAERMTSPMPVITPAPAVETMSQAENPGSLFNEGEADFLFADNRARRVGDIVQVNIVETSTAKNKAETSADRDNSMTIGVENWFGKDTVGLLPIAGARVLGMKGATGTTPLIKASSVSAFEGTGETKRENNFTATVSARVVRLLPGGVMQVEGGSEIRVNDETQILVVRGLVRPSDVGSDNSVLSTQLADARIEYYGKGVLADKQRPGWLSRILENIWPF